VRVQPLGRKAEKQCADGVTTLFPRILNIAHTPQICQSTLFFASHRPSPYPSFHPPGSPHPELSHSIHHPNTAKRFHIAASGGQVAGNSCRGAGAPLHPVACPLSPGDTLGTIATRKRCRGPPTERQAADSWLNEFAEQPGSAGVDLELLRGDQAGEVQFFAANMLLTVVNRQWARMEAGLQANIHQKLRQTSHPFFPTPRSSILQDAFVPTSLECMPWLKTDPGLFTHQVVTHLSSSMPPEVRGIGRLSP